MELYLVPAVASLAIVAHVIIHDKGHHNVNWESDDILAPNMPDPDVEAVTHIVVHRRVVTNTTCTPNQYDPSTNPWVQARNAVRDRLFGEACPLRKEVADMGLERWITHSSLCPTGR